MKEITKTEKGFTLIELMIVVAIIGILAAIAIPQFASYRSKAFNAAAVSDLHTARLAEESVFADYQLYGGSAAAGSTTAVIVNNATVKPVITAGASKEAPITLSKNVELAAAANTNQTIAAIVADHTKGDKEYYAQTDLSGTYQKTKGTLAVPTPTTTGAKPSGYTAM